MKKRIALLSVLSFLIFCSVINVSNDGWKEVKREYKTVNNMTYYFPSEVSLAERQIAIDNCEKYIDENLKLIGETEFTTPMDIEFLNSRKEMLKYSGLSVQGTGFTERNTIFLIHKAKNSPLKHELMHMISMYKWKDTPDSTHWMNEGLATYAGGACDRYSLEEIYKYLLQSKKLLPIKLLTDDFYNQNDMITYTQSAFVCKYLIQNYGMEKFIKLWKGGFPVFKQVYGIQYEEMEGKIEKDINLKFPKAIEFDWEEFNKGC